MPSVYFAGPDVFRADYQKHCGLVRRLCAEAGLTPLCPGLGEARESLGIFHENLGLIRRADAVVANLDPFRGPSEPDSGTVFECAFAFSLGKCVIGVVTDRRDLVTKLRAAGAVADPGSGGYVHEGWQVEDFGLPLNLMLSHALAATAGSLAEAVDLARDRLAARADGR